MTSSLDDFRAAFETIVAGRSLDASTAQRAFGAVLDGEVAEPIVAGFLVALHMKGECAGELAGAARAMRSRARSVDLGADIVDTSGTGGDNASTFNISTGAALIAAAAGVKIAKHGNRAASGRVGGADVLERMGVKIDCDADALRRCLRDCGCCFIFAPAYHPAMARLAPLRRALGIRTLFNVMGPLVNPAHPIRQVMGVGEERLVKPVAEAIAELGAQHAMVVHGLDGLDEISPGAPTFVAEIRGVSIREYEVTPEDFGISRTKRDELRVDDPENAARVLLDALAGGAGPAQDVLALNAAAVIYVGGVAMTLKEAFATARRVLASGRALEVVEHMRRASRGER